MAGPYPQYPEPQPSYPPSSTTPPVPYPGRRWWKPGLVIAVVLVVVAAATAAIVYAANVEPKPSGTTTGRLTEASATSAIQSYLDALLDGDTETVARNAGCGLYDAATEKRSDQAVARLASQSFRKQFSKAQVTGIDKVVSWSENQFQVLFTMRVAPVIRTARERDEQATANLLSADGTLYVCQYLLRSGSQY